MDSEFTKRKNAAEEEVGCISFWCRGKWQRPDFLETIGDSSNILLALDIEENQGGKNLAPKQAE